MSDRGIKSNIFDSFDAQKESENAFDSFDVAPEQPEELAPEGAWESGLRELKAKALPAIGTALGGAGAGLLASPESGFLATIPAAIAGGAVGGAGGEKLYETIIGEEQAKKERAQMEANARAHPWATSAGGAIPMLVSLLGGGGLAKTIGQKAAQKALTSEAAAGLDAAALKALGQKAAEEAADKTLVKVGESALTGAKLGASETAQRAVEGDEVGLKDFADAMAKDAVTFGPFGVLPHVESLAKSLGMAIPQAYLSTIASSAYDSMVHGKPFDVQDIAGKGGAQVVPFAIFNAISHGVAAGQKLSARPEAKTTPEGTPEAAPSAEAPAEAPVPAETAPQAELPTELPAPPAEPSPAEAVIAPAVDTNLQAGNPKVAEALAALPAQLEAQKAAEAAAASVSVPTQQEWLNAIRVAPRVRISSDPQNRLTKPDVATVPLDAPAGSRVVLPTGEIGTLTDRALNPKMNSRQVALDDGGFTEYNPAFGSAYDPKDLKKHLPSQHKAAGEALPPDESKPEESPKAAESAPVEAGTPLRPEPAQPPTNETPEPAPQEVTTEPSPPVLEETPVGGEVPASVPVPEVGPAVERVEPPITETLRAKEEQPPEQRHAEETQAVDELNSQIGAYATRVKVADPSKVHPAFAKFRNLFESLFGHRVILVQPENPAEEAWHGARRGSTGDIFINADSPIHTRAILGHEFTHALETSHKDLHDELMSAIKRLGIFTPEQVEQYGKQRLKGLYKKGAWEEEVINNMVGDRFFDGEIFDRLAKEDPNLFLRLAQAVREWIGHTLEKLKGAVGYDMAGRMGLEPDKLKSLDEHLAKAMTEVAKRQESQKLPEGEQKDATNQLDLERGIQEQPESGDGGRETAEASPSDSVQREEESGGQNLPTEPQAEDVKLSADTPEDLIDITVAGRDAAREKWGMDEAQPAPRVGFEKIAADAKAELDRNPTKPQVLVDAVLNDGHQATKEEQALMEVYEVQLTNELNGIQDAGIGDPRALAIYDKLDKLMQASRLTGSYQGQALALRKMRLKRDFSPAGLIHRAKSMGIELTPEKMAEIQKFAKDFKDLEEKRHQKEMEDLRQSSAEQIEQLRKETESLKERDSTWVEDALDEVDADMRSSVDAVLDELLFQQEAAKKLASLQGTKFSAEGEFKSAMEARREKIADRLKTLEAATDPKAVQKMIADSKTIAKSHAEKNAPKVKTVIDKATAGDKAAVRLLNALTNPVKRSKASEPVRMRFAQEVREPTSKEQFVEDMKKLGVDEQNAIKLHEQAAIRAKKQSLKEEAEMTAKKVTDGDGVKATKHIIPLPEIEAKIKESHYDSIDQVPHGTLQSAIRSLLSMGVKDEREIIKQLTQMLDRAGVKATEDEVREHSVRYGHAPKPSQEELDVAQRDIRAQSLKVASLERVLKSEPPLKTGQQRDKPSQKVRDLMKQLKDAMARMGISLRSSDQQLASSEDAVITRIKNDIEDLDAQIAKGERSPKRVSPTHSKEFMEERQKLMDRKKELQAILDSVAPKPDTSVEDREKRLLSAAERMSRMWQDRLRNAEFEDKEKGGPVSEKVKEARKTAAAMKEAFEQARDLARPDLKKDPNALALARYKRLLERREADISRRISEKDFSKVVRRKTVLDEEAEKQKLAVQRLQNKFNNQLKEWTEANRSKSEKFWDIFPKLKRFSVLTSPVVFGKLAAASMTRGFTTALEEVAGGAWSKIFPELAKRAKLEGGTISASGLVKAIRRAHMRAIDDAKKTLSDGSDLDVAQGKGDHGKDMWGLPGRLHAMMKAPIKRAIYEHAFEKLSEAYVRDGGDPLDLVNNELVITKLSQAAYKAANRGIFLQDNALVDGYNAFIKRMEGMKGTSGPALARIAQTLLPIVRVPSNIVMETAQHVAGLPIGLVRLAKAWHNGMDKLTEAEADSILRTMKKGSLGAGLMLLGFYANSPAFAAGGYYNHDEHRKPGDPKVGGFKVFGVNVPSWLTHSPAFEAIQFGATIRRSMNNHPEGHALAPAALAASIGLAEETPFLNEMLRTKYLATEKGRGQFFGELAKSQIEPQLLSKVAEWTDRARPLEPLDLLTGEGTQARTPQNFSETLQSGLPGLRKTLPMKVSNALPPNEEKIPQAIQTYAQKGYQMPSTPDRGPLAKKNGYISNDLWNAYAVLRGKSVQRQMLANMDELMGAEDDKERKKVTMEISRQASYEAKQLLNLQ